MELLKSLGWTVIGIVGVILIICGMDWITHIKYVGPIFMGVMLLGLITFFVHSVRMSDKEREERRKNRGW